MTNNSSNGSTEISFTEIGLGAEFPIGLRVMAIDSDLGCLNILRDLLVKCNFIVSYETSARNALERVYNQNEDYDIVVTELINLDVDAFGFLESMRKRMPVIVVLSNLDDKRMIMKAVTGGVADYMLKPATLEMMRNIWQHVLRSRLTNNGIHIWRNPNLNPNPNPSPSQTKLTEGGTEEKQQDDSIDETYQNNNITDDKDYEGNDGDNYILDDDSNPVKKTRIAWSDELHKRFLKAVDQLGGPDSAKPKQILELMNIPGLSRENVASHLQKYRLALKNQLKVQPIWMENTNEAIAANGVISNNLIMAVVGADRPLPATNNASSSILQATTGAFYSQYDCYNNSVPMIDPQYDHMFNPNLFKHPSPALYGIAPQVMQQPPIAPGENLISNNMRVTELMFRPSQGDMS